MSLAPYTAVVLTSYGGPNGPDDVLPFMRNATAGRNIPDSRLIEVSKHYELFGGRSPINELNAALKRALADELARRGVTSPIVIGNRNWHPFIGDVARELVDAGHAQVLALATSAYASYSSCRQYHEDLLGARRDLSLAVDKIAPFAQRPAFAHANARALTKAVRALRARVGQARLKVLFVTHSIPMAMESASATEDQLRYRAQHVSVATRVAQFAGAALGEELMWELTFCSRSGAPHVAWLEPDINDRLPELRGEGVEAVVAAPIGFISDHMEVAYDLDTQANQTAAEVGLPYERAATVGTDPGFVRLLVDLLLERAAQERGELPPLAECLFSTGRCCLPRPQPVEEPK